MADEKRYWLFKSEPEVFGIDDLILAENQATAWDGVRNYQARNFLRDDVQVGDEVLFYHSRNAPIGVAGVALVTRAAFADPLQFDESSKYHDEKATPEEPRWYAVEITFQQKFEEVVTLKELKAHPDLTEMLVTKRGQRLSIQPVQPEEFRIVVELGRAKDLEDDPLDLI